MKHPSDDHAVSPAMPVGPVSVPRARTTPLALRSLLVTLTGRDRPGVTSRLFDELARFPLVVLDTEQMVLRGRLILGVLVDLGAADPADELALRDGLSQAARELGLEIEMTVGPA